MAEVSLITQPIMPDHALRAPRGPGGGWVMPPLRICRNSTAGGALDLCTACSNAAQDIFFIRILGCLSIQDITVMMRIG